MAIKKTSTKKMYIFDNKTNDLLLKALELANVKEAELVRYAVQVISEKILNGEIDRDNIIDKARLVTFEREK